MTKRVTCPSCGFTWTGTWNDKTGTVKWWRECVRCPYQWMVK